MSTFRRRLLMAAMSAAKTVMAWFHGEGWYHGSGWFYNDKN